MKEKTTSAIDPHQIIRRRDGEKYFGLKHAAIEMKIQSGDLPMPIPLSENGRATGWTGQQIIDHRTRMLEIAAEHAVKRQDEADHMLKRTRRSKVEA